MSAADPAAAGNLTTSFHKVTAANTAAATANNYTSASTAAAAHTTAAVHTTAASVTNCHSHRPHNNTASKH